MRERDERSGECGSEGSEEERDKRGAATKGAERDVG